MNKTETEIIEGMLELLNSPERWCKFLLYDDRNDSYCLVGALCQVATGQWHRLYETPEMVSLVNVMTQVANDKGYGHDLWGCGSIVRFNNAPETEYEDVRLFLKEALEKVA